MSTFRGLTHDEEASYIRVVKLERGKNIDVPMSGSKVYHKSFLVEKSVPDISPYNRESAYRYNEESSCHIIEHTSFT